MPSFMGRLFASSSAIGWGGGRVNGGQIGKEEIA